jgi:hypothetical protein
MTRDPSWCEELAKAQAGCTERLCTRDDVTHAVALYREAAMWARRHGQTGKARACIDGGAVPFSYPADAQATRITVTPGRVVVERVKARRIAHGDDGQKVRAFRAPPGMAAKDSRIKGAWKYDGEIRW